MSRAQSAGSALLRNDIKRLKHINVSSPAVHLVSFSEHNIIVLMFEGAILNLNSKLVMSYVTTSYRLSTKRSTNTNRKLQ